MSSPPINLPTWKVAIGIALSITFIILIEKVFGIHVNIRYRYYHPSLWAQMILPLTLIFSQGPMATFPGWAHVLGPGETQISLLHRWIETHRSQTHENTIKSKQLAVDV